MSDKDVAVNETPVLEQIGTLLRETREAKEITLDTVQEETKIRRHYLQALEQGKKELLPGDVYLKGFLKNYANFLGLPGEELVRRYSQSQDQENKATPEHISWKVPSESNRYRRQIVVPIMLLVILIMAGLGLTRMIKAPNSGPISPPPAANEPPPSLPEISDPNIDTNQETLPGESIVQTVLDTPTEIVYKVSADSLQVKLTINSDRCWVASRIDDSAEISETLTTGSSRTLSAKDKIWLRAGNPHVLDLTVNGVHLGVAGQPGQPRNIIFECLRS
jgi:cytoskeleton protein RodZ